MTPDTIAVIGSALSAVLIAVVGFLVERRDKKKAAKREIKAIPDNAGGADRFRQWVLDTKNKTDGNF